MSTYDYYYSSYGSTYPSNYPSSYPTYTGYTYTTDYPTTGGVDGSECKYITVLNQFY